MPDTPPATPVPHDSENRSFSNVSALNIGGYIFLCISAICILLLAAHLFRTKALPSFFMLGGASKITESQLALALVDHYLTFYFAPIVLLLAAVLAAFLGYLLLRVAGTASKEIIPRQDYALLSELLLSDKEKGVDQYVRLSSLSGMTGVFTKVGLTGLPLATITLTIFFTVLSLFTSGTAFIDLAKLTLGAFIGSYVQKQVEQTREREAGAP